MVQFIDKIDLGETADIFVTLVNQSSNSLHKGAT